MKKSLILSVVVIAFVIGGIWYGRADDEGVETIKIGSILPLSGDFALLGEEIRRGAEIAVEEAHAAGLDVVYISEDDRLEPTGAANTANKLVRVDKVDAVFTGVVQEAKPITPIFSENKIPLLVTWDSNEFLKQAGEYIFSIGFSTEAAGKRMATYAYKELGLRDIAIINHIDEWSELISDSFSEVFRLLGGKIVMREKTQITEKDYRTNLTKVKQLNPDGIYFPMLPLAKGPFLIQTKQLGLKSALLTGDGLLQDEIDFAGVAAEGVYLTNIFSENSDELGKKYKAKYNADPADIVFVSFGYDGVNTILQGYKIASEQNLTLRDALAKVNFQGTGSVINMNGANYSEREEKVYKVSDGKPIPVE